ncbi:MAG: NeuD/PglB/VioB family sugar acetyltransferase [Gemmatimonadota bacterium]|nr:NeuD/PglB/VioB family sugar acetyltransferase [Gemmatimonadota bacterium]
MGRPSERFLVWGGGGHGKVVADLLRALGHQVAGYVDSDAGKLGEQVEPGGGRVVRTQEGFLAELEGREEYPPEVDAVALAIGNNPVRLECARRLGSLGIPPLVHPSAIVSPSAVLGRGTVLFPRAVVNAAASVGEAAIINTGAIVEHDCVVGDGAHLSPGAVLTGGAQVGPCSWIGAGAVVLPGVRVGAGVVVGAGAVVIRDVRDGAKVVGVPARSIAQEGQS